MDTGARSFVSLTRVTLAKAGAQRHLGLPTALYHRSEATEETLYARHGLPSSATVPAGL